MACVLGATSRPVARVDQHISKVIWWFLVAGSEAAIRRQDETERSASGPTTRPDQGAPPWSAQRRLS
jgi:hypothetical protein